MFVDFEGTRADLPGWKTLSSECELIVKHLGEGGIFFFLKD